MRHDYLNNTPLEEAREIFLTAAREAGFTASEETVRTAEAAGRITSRAVYALLSVPHYNASAMDGVALRAEKTYGASEKRPVTLTRNDFAVVDTGDPLPDGADAVVMIEDVREDDEGNIKLLSSVAPWTNVRQVGEDLCMGDMIAPSGTRVTPALIGALLAGGVTELSVKKKPVFGVIPTGDEIVPPTSTPQKGEILEFNSAIVSAQLAEWGAVTKVCGIVRDEKPLLREAVARAAAECDAVIVLAGSSAGRDDYTAELCAEAGTVLLHGAAIKPGKPVVLGEAHGRPFVGLPGYPVSAMVALEQFIKPLCGLYYTLPEEEENTIPATLTKRVVTSLKYEEFVRVTLGTVGGTTYAVPLPRGAGVITSVTKAGGILRVPRDSEGFETGQTVPVRLLRPESEIKNTLVITGSHDPLIDEIADEINRRGAGFTVVSSHVGSMGALRAVAAGQAHMGACHLLDGETGEYNKSYVAKYLPDGGASLRSGVGRIQGLMVAPGNPLGIRGLADLTRCRYVNRQRGAGTRVLLDYLMGREGLNAEDIDGYGNEKSTHTAVAATVASGNADAGMGILSAARIFGLDFIELWHEEYDFLVADDAADDPKVKTFFEILESPSFRQRLREMGGYSFRNEDGTWN